MLHNRHHQSILFHLILEKKSQKVDVAVAVMVREDECGRSSIMRSFSAERI
jgi:hypothetical protein